MSKIYIPTTSPDQWKQLLADPEKHWQKGYSARTLAKCWQSAEGFPEEIRATLSTFSCFDKIEMLLALPEHKVSLPGGSSPSQNDIWVLARAGDDLVSIAVEGKVSESFGPTIKKWRTDSSPGKDERLKYLCDKLGLEQPLPDKLRYQLLHRTASAIIEAERFNASHAVMLVHSFSQSDECFQDYKDFVALFGKKASVDQFVSVGTRGNVSLHFAWVRGEVSFLEQ